MPSTTTTTQKGAVSVIHELLHAAQQYRIITADEEIIHRTGEQIVRACQLQINASAWSQNFHLVLVHISKWCADRSDKISFALVDLRTEKTVFYIVPKSSQFDFDLANNQAELDIFLNTRGGIGYAETRQVPAWEIERFVSTDARRVWPQT